MNTMTTRRENLIAALKGEPHGWTPCSLNIAQWYTHHRNFGLLPEELAGTRDLIDAMKVLGMDIFSRNLDGGFRCQHRDVREENLTETGRQDTRAIRRYHTPHGTLQSVKEAQSVQSTEYDVEHLVKDWALDRDAALWLVDHMVCTWDPNVFSATRDRVGDDGVVMAFIGQTPLKYLHILMGLDKACLFIMDYPEDAQHLCDLYWRRLWPALERFAAHPDTTAAILMDNVDTPFYPPSLCKTYWTPYVKQAAELMDANGKFLFVHACGKLKGLKEEFRASGLHGLEGAAHPPLGDFTPADARDLHDTFVYNGGFSAHEQVTRSDDELDAFYRDLFEEMAGEPRWIFGAACQTTVTTPFQRIKRVIELCRRYGRT